MSPPSRVSFRRLLLGLGLGVVFLLAVAFLQPYPSRQEGAVFCLPVVGPQTSLPRGLSDSDAARIRAHETAHMEQCTKLGFARVLVAQWTPNGRLRLEAEAGCAEARFDWRGGRRPDHVFEGLVDNLIYGLPRGLAPTPDAARSAAAQACPDLEAAAQAFTPADAPRSPAP